MTHSLMNHFTHGHVLVFVYIRQLCLLKEHPCQVSCPKSYSFVEQLNELKQNVKYLNINQITFFHNSSLGPSRFNFYSHGFKPNFSVLWDKCKIHV